MITCLQQGQVVEAGGRQGGEGGCLSVEVPIAFSHSSESAGHSHGVNETMNFSGSTVV